MMADGVSDETIARLLRAPAIIAIVGASANPDRPSYSVMAFLIARGFTVRPVNPGLAGQLLLGAEVYASLADVPSPVDIVDIFRNSEAAAPAVDEALVERKRLGLKAIWMQLGVVNVAAGGRARDAGLIAVMDRCPKIEITRLGLGLSGPPVTRHINQRLTADAVAAPERAIPHATRWSLYGKLVVKGECVVGGFCNCYCPRLFVRQTCVRPRLHHLIACGRAKSMATAALQLNVEHDPV